MRANAEVKAPPSNVMWQQLQDVLWRGLRRGPGARVEHFIALATPEGGSTGSEV